MFIRRLVKSCLSSLPIIKMGFGKMPMVTRFRAYPVWETFEKSFRHPGWKQLAVTPQAIPKRGKHTNKGPGKPEFGFGPSQEQPTYDINQEKFINAEPRLSQKVEQKPEDQHHLNQKYHWKNLKEKIQQRAPLWEPKQHLKRDDFTEKQKGIKSKVAEVFVKKNAESFPLQKTKPSPKQ